MGYFNTMVGGVRLRQARTDLLDCPNSDEDLVRSMHRGACVSTAHDWHDKPDFMKAVTHSFDSDLSNKPGGEDVFLLSGWNQSVVRQELNKIENYGWLNPQTKKVEILITTYNAHKDVLSVTYIFFFWNRAGQFHKVVESMGLALNPYQSWYVGIFDCCWLLLVVKIVVEEACEVFRHVRQLGLKQGMAIYISISNLVDWTVITFSLYFCFAWWAYLVKLDELKEKLKQASPTIEGSWPNEADRIDYFDQVAEISTIAYQLRPYLAFYLLIIGLRLFKAFHAQPRLALVTKTLSKSTVDIFHFLIVFGALFAVYSFMGLIMFGPNLPDFAWPQKAFHTTFLVLIGEFGKWDELFEISWYQSFVWSWSFKIMADFVMLNMFVALILDVYTEVRGRAIDSRTLWEQAAENWRRWRQRRRGERLHLHDVLVQLDPMTLNKKTLECSDGCIDVSGLMELVPKLGEPQARRILKNSLLLAQADSSENRGNSLADTSKHVHHVSTRTDQIHRIMKELVVLNADLSTLVFAAHEAVSEPASPRGSAASNCVQTPQLNLAAVPGTLRIIQETLHCLQNTVAAIPNKVTLAFRPEPHHVEVREISRRWPKRTNGRRHELDSVAGPAVVRV